MSSLLPKGSASQPRHIHWLGQRGNFALINIEAIDFPKCLGATSRI